MYRNIRQKFQQNEIRPNTNLIELPNIGPYLYERLRRKFAPRARDITIRQLFRNTRNMTTQELKEGLQRALQNEHANQCTGKPGRRYHIRDVNEKGWLTMIALFRVAYANHDGYNLWQNLQANPNNIRYAAQRSEDAKKCGCKSRNACRHPCVWQNGLCQYTDGTGFEGIGAYPGQRIHSNNAAIRNQHEQRGRTLEHSTPRHMRDPDTATDVRAGHNGMRYSVANQVTKLRRPSAIVRLPLNS